MTTQHQDVICNLTMPDLSRYRQAIPAVLPSLPLKQKHQLPPVPAVYFALGEDNEVLYIGRSGSLSARWLTHHRFPALQSIGNVRLVWIEFETEEFLEEVERVLINHFSPKLNGLREREIDPDSLRTKGVFARFTEKEKRDLLRLAKEDNRKVADWVRVATLEKMAREKAAAKEKEESGSEQ